MKGRGNFATPKKSVPQRTPAGLLHPGQQPATVIGDDEQNEVIRLVAEANRKSSSGNYLQAASLFREALAYRPKEPDLWYDYAVALKLGDRPILAMRAVKESLRLDQSQAAYWYTLGNLHVRLSHFRAAEAHLIRAIEIEPDYVDALANLARLYLHLDRVEDADLRVSRGLELSPEDISLRYHRGRILMKRHCFDQARSEFEFVLSRSPNDEDALAYLEKLTLLEK